MPPEERETPEPAARSGSFRQLLLGFVITFICLAALEALSSFLPISRMEPWQIDQSYPMYERGEGEFQDRLVTSKHFQNYAAKQTFAAEKPPGVTRIFLLGGSAALGWPSEEICSTSGFLRQSLDSLLPERYEIINAAVMSFGSHRVLDLLDDVIALQPDIVIIWSGNNEYVEVNSLPYEIPSSSRLKIRRLLNHSSLYRTLRAGIRQFAPNLLSHKTERDLTDFRSSPRVARGSVGRSQGTDQRVLHNYQNNLRNMARRLEENHIKSLFCTVPVNLAAWAPETASPQFSDPDQYVLWTSLIRQGMTLLDSGQPAQATPYFQQIVKMTPEYALGPFFLGWALQRSGRYQEAYAMLQQARDLDTRALRALGPFNAFIRTLSQDFPDSRIVDLEAAFLQTSPENLVGMDLFYDYCHPNTFGHQIAAKTLLHSILSLSRPELSAQSDERVFALDCPEPSPARQAATTYALGLTHSNNGDYAKAEAAYRSALSVRPDFVEAMSNLALLLIKRGDFDEAETLCERALALSPDSIGPLFQLATIRLDQERLADAKKLLERTLALNPSFAEAQETLGDLAVRQGDPAVAEQAYRQAIALGGGRSSLHLKFGDLLHSEGNPKEAAEQWQLALNMDPGNRLILDRLASGASKR